MASISQGIVLTTAMLFSSTVLYLAFSRQKASSPFQITQNPNSHNPNKQFLRSCLYSDEKRRERNKKKKKKRVKFSENVMVKEVRTENYEENREGQRKQNREERRNQNRACRNETGEEIRGMPANRIALYNGILRDRGQRMACCH